MKGMYINSRSFDERDNKVVGALMEDHEIAIHRDLWTADNVQGEFGFAVTNMPYDEMSMTMRRIYSHLPEEEYYAMIYATSFTSLDRLHEAKPGMIVIAYTGADRQACIQAMEKHHASHVIRRGRYEVEYEIQEIKRVLAGEDFTPVRVRRKQNAT